MKNIFILLVLLNLSINNLCLGQWEPLGSGIEGPGPYSFLYDSTYDLLFVGGYFNYTIDSLKVNGVATWDGVAWDSVGGGVPYGMPVISLGKYQNKILASGLFAYTFPNLNNYLGLWNGNYWDTLNKRINGPLYCYKEYNGDLYLGGSFTKVGGVKSNSITKLTDTSFTLYNFPCQDWDFVRAIEFYNGDLYIGGNFYDTITGVNDLEKWNGNSFQPFGGSGLNFGGAYVSSMVIYNNELLIAGGFNYNGSSGVYRNIMSWDGIQFKDFGGGTNGTIRNMKNLNGEIYISGDFDMAGNVSIPNWMAKWDGYQWSDAFPETLDVMVNDFIIVNNDLYIAGGFTKINNVTFNHIARYRNYVGVSVEERSNYITYNNPAHGNLIVQMANSFNTKYELIDMFGRMVTSGEIKSNNFKIDVSTFPEGIYILSVNNRNIFLSKKVVILRD